MDKQLCLVLYGTLIGNRTVSSGRRNEMQLWVRKEHSLLKNSAETNEARFTLPIWQVDAKATWLFWDLMTLQVTVLFASPFRVIKDIDIKCDTNWWEIIKYAIFAAVRAPRLAIKQYYHSEIHIDRYHSDTNFFGYRLRGYARSLNLDTIK